MFKSVPAILVLLFGILLLVHDRFGDGGLLSKNDQIVVLALMIMLLLTTLMDGIALAKRKAKAD